MVEVLEKRLLLMAYNTGDYFPLAEGLQWEYAGRYWHSGPDTAYDRQATMSSSVKEGFLNGIAASSITDRIRPVGWTTDDQVKSSWYSVGEEGLRAYGGTVAGQRYLYSQLMLPAVVEDGQAFDLVPASFVTENASGYAGTIGGRVVVHGTEQLATPNGWQIAALKVTYTQTMTGQIQSGDTVANILQESTFTAWYGRSAGLVKSTLSSTQTTSGSGVQTQTYASGEEWLISGPALPYWASLTDGELHIAGTQGADFVSFTQEAGGIRVLRNSDSLLVAGVTRIRVYGEGGSDAITMQGLHVAGELYGNDGNDTIIGGELPDLIYAGDGEDVVRSAGGSDTVFANTGNDDVDAGTGADWVFAGLGNDVVRGGQGPDSLAGGDGTDEIRGGLGADHIEGRGKSDSLYGGEKNDTIYGGAGSDYIDLGEGDDWANVDAHALFHDSVYGGAGADTVRADSDDLLYEVETVLLP